MRSITPLYHFYHIYFSKFHKGTSQENITAVTQTCRFFLYNIYSTQLLLQAMVLSRLDYCNSLIAGLPASATRPLQLILNAAARLIFNVPRYTHTSPKPPPPPPPPHTCTSRSQLLSVLAPRWWNNLPVDIRTAETLTTFKRRLKTHLFRLHLSFPPS